MIDTTLSLAFALQSNRGVYALLVGSGVSRSAGIPTGWEIVLDLIRKLSHLRDENCEPDPVAWYRSTFKEEPHYAKLIEGIAKSPVERSQLLKSYFEPNKEELEQGLKVPTEAHKAIADMVANGYIRVIVTTNFDRLLEKALEEVGVTATVISTPDAAEGAIPLTHTRCTILKVHGDYLDTRIKNTPDELTKFDNRIDGLLDRIFDEFGLIICGWSAEWDIALRAALERCKNHRFTTFWTLRNDPNETVKKLISLRRAQPIQIQDADSFFQDLMEKVIALQNFSKPHPLSAKVAVVTLKKYISNDSHIALHDLVTEETEKLYTELSIETFPLGIPYSDEELIRRSQQYENLTEVLKALIITGCYWGEKKHEKIWVKCLDRIANMPTENRMINHWENLRLYPALIVLYSGGIASIASGQYESFYALISKPKVRDKYSNTEEPIVLKVNLSSVMERGIAQQLPGMANHHTPLSDQLYNVLRDSLRDILPDDTHYQKSFDRFEYLLALVHADLRAKYGYDMWWQIGRFSWPRHRLTGGGIVKEIETESNEEGKDWSPLKAGLFEGSFDRFKELKDALDQYMGQIHWI